MGIKFFVDPSETDIKHFQVTGVDSETGAVATEDHWVELRMDLSDREWAELEMGIASRANDQGEIILDFAGLSTRQLVKWIRAWSFYQNGNPGARVKPTESYLGLLDRDIADQIREIIKAHIEDRKVQRDAMRNPTNGSGPTAPLVGGSVTSETTSSPTPGGHGTLSLLPTDSEA